MVKSKFNWSKYMSCMSANSYYVGFSTGYWFKNGKFVNGGASKLQALDRKGHYELY